MWRGDVLLWWIPSTTEMLDVLVVVVVGAPSQLLHAYSTENNTQDGVAAALYSANRWCRVSSGNGGEVQSNAL